MRDRRFAPIFILILLGLGIVFFLQNSTPTLPLVFFGMELPSLPLAAWLVLGAIAGFATSLAFGWLWRWSLRSFPSPSSDFAKRDMTEETTQQPTPSNKSKKRSRKKTAKPKATAASKRERQSTPERYRENEPEELDEPAPWDNWEEPQDTPINVQATATSQGQPRDQQLKTTEYDQNTPGGTADDDFPDEEEKNYPTTNTTEWFGEEFFEDWKQELYQNPEPSEDTGDTGEFPPGKTYERYRQPIRQYWSGSVYSYTYADPETSTTPEASPDQVPVESESEPEPEAKSEPEAEMASQVPTQQPSTPETTAEEVSWDESLKELEIEDRETQETEETTDSPASETSSDVLPEPEDEQEWQTGRKPSPPSTGLAQRFVQSFVQGKSQRSQKKTENTESQETTKSSQKSDRDVGSDDWETPPRKSDRENDW